MVFLEPFDMNKNQENESLNIRIESKHDNELSTSDNKCPRTTNQV